MTQELESKSVAIRLNGPINNSTINSLMSTIDNKMKEGINDFVLLLSSHGGDTAAGLTGYNYLKGIACENNYLQHWNCIIHNNSALLYRQ